MTTTLEVPAVSATEGVASQVRAEVARRRLTWREVARQTTKSHAYWWRRMSGEVPFDVEDLVTVAGILNVPVSVLVAPLDGPGTARAPMVE